MASPLDAMSTDDWLLALVIALLALGPLSLLRARVARPAPRARAFVALGGLGLLAGATGAWSMLVEPRWVDSTEVRLDWQGPPLSLVLIGDIHAGRTDRALLGRVVDEVNAREPDLVLLGGDFISGYQATPERLAILEGLGRLRARSGVYAVLGNHDSEPYGKPIPRADRIAGRLEGLGITVLRNASAEPLPGVTLVGLDDALSGHADPGRAFAGLPSSGARLVLTHEWQTLGKPGAGRFDLALAAHTHGGQLCVPFTRVCPFADEQRPFVAGLYDWPSGGKLFVTRGLGESAILARLGCRPEIATIVLSPRESTGPEASR